MDAGSALLDGQDWTRRGTVERAYELFHAEIERRLTGLLRDGDIAEELAQEAFLRLHVEVSAGRSPDNVRAWLHRVAANLVTSRGRHAQVAQRQAPRLATIGEATSTEDLAVRHDGEARLRLALAELRPGEREILLLAASGFSGPEIAARLGRSQSATRTLLCRARRHLRQRVARLESAA
jgi:RNA polymerase sigma-70 factor, ECF subfamily